MNKMFTLYKNIIFLHYRITKINCEKYEKICSYICAMKKI